MAAVKSVPDLCSPPEKKIYSRVSEEEGGKNASQGSSWCPWFPVGSECAAPQAQILCRLQPTQHSPPLDPFAHGRWLSTMNRQAGGLDIRITPLRRRWAHWLGWSRWAEPHFWSKTVINKCVICVTSVAECCRTQRPFLISVLLKECATTAEDVHERRPVSNVYNNCLWCGDQPTGNIFRFL